MIFVLAAVARNINSVAEKTHRKVKEGLFVKTVGMVSHGVSQAVFETIIRKKVRKWLSWIPLSIH